MSIALPKRAKMQIALPWLVLAFILILIVASVAFHEPLFHRGAALANSGAAVAVPPTDVPPAPAASATTVTLPDGKFQAAGIKTEGAKLIGLPSEIGVAGKIEANQDRHVSVRPRASGVIREVKVALGQVVKKGDVLAVLDSPDVGSARLTLRAKQRELSTVRTEADWKRQVAANVASLVADLKKETEASIIEKQYAQRPLGSFRGQLMQAYADFDIAVHEEEKTAALHKEKIIGEHLAFVAKHTREGAQAKYQGAIEQARFDANQQSLVANQQVRLAEAAVIDAAQRLRILGVAEDIDALLAKADEASVGRLADEDVVAYPIVAPFDGTIIVKVGGHESEGRFQ